MKLLLALLILAGAARAEEMVCPKRHPDAPQDRLTGAGMYHGPNKEYELIGEYRKARGGHDVHFGFHGDEVKWLVCAYADRRLWWHRMEPRTTSCLLQERGKRQISARLVCK